MRATKRMSYTVANTAGHGRQENLDSLPQIVHNAYMSRVIDARHAERCAARNKESLHVWHRILKYVSVVVDAHRTFQERGSEFEKALRTRVPDVSQKIEKLYHSYEALVHASIIVKIQVSLMGRHCAPLHIPSERVD